MRFLLFIFLPLILIACASLPAETFDMQYSDAEIARMTAQHFEVMEPDAKAALKPAFKKYGAPHAFIDGMMSSIDDPNVEYLYGSGHFKTKLSLNEHTFWRVEGDKLSGHLAPVKTAHLVYKTLRLDPLSESLEFSETLTKRGQTFTVFERKVGNDIVITFHKSEDLRDTSLESVRFFNE